MALPGLHGAEHIGFTVPDIDEAHRFLVDVIGCELIYSLPPIVRDDDWMSTHLNVDDASVVDEIRFYRCGFGPNFEVFQYTTPVPQRSQPQNSDIGGHHVALYVDDIDDAVNYLAARDVRILGKPTSSGNASKGQRWVYFLAPWGMQFELVSFPDGKAYEANQDRKLWHPRFPLD